MVKIRRLTLFDIDTLKAMIEHDELAISLNLLEEKHFTPFPLDILHEMLPVNKRFLQESYVAVEDNELIGVICVIPDGKQRSRWKINKLILHRDSESVGKQLIDFVISKYGAQGVETFISVIDEDNASAISILKDQCNFRSCSKIQVWKLENLEHINESFDTTHFRAANLKDANSALEMDTQNLFPQFKNSLSKHKKDFQISLSTRIQNHLNNYRPKYIVIENSKNNSIEGFFTLLTQDFQKFWLDATISLAYQDYFEDIIKYSVEYCLRKGSNPQLYTYIRKYYQSSNKSEEYLKNYGFKLVKNQEVLVKDFWKPIKAEEKNKSTVIIFPDSTSPA